MPAKKKAPELQSPKKVPEDIQAIANAMPDQLFPPMRVGGSEMERTQPIQMPEEQAHYGEAMTPAMPTEMPPGQEAITGGVTATWLSDKRVQGLWSMNSEKNSWIFIKDVGWKKLAPTTDASVIAMTMLASHALQAQRRIDYREEADGMIYEMYIW